MTPTTSPESLARETDGKDHLSFFFVGTGLHPSHLKLLEGLPFAIVRMKQSADRSNRISRVLEYARALPHLLLLRGNFLVEGSRLCALLAPILARRGKVFCLAAEDFSYTLQHKPGRLDRFLFHRFRRYVKGIIAIGEVNHHGYQDLCPEIPAVLAYPPYSEQALEYLLTIQPDLKSHNVLFIGAGNPFCKGVDIALETITLLQVEYPDAQLIVAGQKTVRRQKGVTALGWVNDISTILKDASILVQPGRGDAFGISCVEALASGLPILVSEHTGARTLAAELSPQFVLSLDPKQFAEAIRRIWLMDNEQRVVLSNSAKKIAIGYTRKSQMKTLEVISFLNNTLLKMNSG